MNNNKPWIFWMVAAAVLAGGWKVNDRYHHDHRFRRAFNERWESVQGWWQGLFAPMPVISEESEQEAEFHQRRIEEQLGNANFAIGRQKQMQQMMQGIQGGFGTGETPKFEDHNPRDDDDAGASYEYEDSPNATPEE
ncbi:MAG: hypothetical protein HY594_04775 [Candidatus Omnitrophica bacterium]|nr:hypothetical protein [Candidatus Omnitrophota bacterium]